MPKRKNHLRAKITSARDVCSLISPREDCRPGELWREGTPPKEDEAAKKQSFQKARYWLRENGFIRMILRCRQAYYHYGFSLTDPAGVPLPAADEWWNANRAAILNYARDAWHDWLAMDNVIALWRNSGRVLVKPPEEIIRYTDFFGEEELTIAHGMSGEQIRAAGYLSEKEKQRLAASTQIQLTHADTLFHFEVLKRELLGGGLASTGLRPVFLAAACQESLEVSDALLAFACRNVYEQHLKGHEIKSSPHAGSPAHFLKKPTADAIKKELQHSVGFKRLVTNFDHKILMGAGLPDPKQFAGSRYEAVFDRMLFWAMPLGHLLLMKSVNPYLPEMLRVLAHAEREYMALHLETIIKAVWKRDVRAVWSDRCFQDTRIFVELMKFGLQSGPVSQRTYLNALNLDQKSEQEAKAQEATAPDGRVTPRYDAAHGDPKKTGRPAGTGDNTRTQ